VGASEGVESDAMDDVDVVTCGTCSVSADCTASPFCSRCLFWASRRCRSSCSSSDKRIASIIMSWGTVRVMCDSSIWV
jgi:hypothetical protein